MSRPDLRPTRLLHALPLLLASTLAAADVGSYSTLALMHRLFTVNRAPFKVIRAELDAEAPDWEKVRQAGERYNALAAALAKKTPRHGTPESWRRLIDQHTSDAGAMSAAARAQDLAALRAAHRRIATSCKACHDAHRARRGG
jgi:cytochrome c556